MPGKADARLPHFTCFTSAKKAHLLTPEAERVAGSAAAAGAVHNFSHLKAVTARLVWARPGPHFACIITCTKGCLEVTKVVRARPGPPFTCITSTTVHTLTPEEVRWQCTRTSRCGIARSARARSSPLCAALGPPAPRAATASRYKRMRLLAS